MAGESAFASIFDPNFDAHADAAAFARLSLATDSPCAPDGILPTADGSGIVLVQVYYQRPAVLLFRSHSRTVDLGEYGRVKIYELPGGGCDSSKDAPSLTAKRELLEESSNFFFLKTPTVRAAPSETVGNYRVYIALLDDSAGKIRSDNHAHNVTTIVDYHKKNNGGVPHPWLEMDKMARVYVDDLVASGLPCRDVSKGALPLLVKDASGDPIMIYPRDASALKKHLSNLTTKLQLLKPVKLLKPVQMSQSAADKYNKPWLKGTWTHAEA